MYTRVEDKYTKRCLGVNKQTNSAIVFVAKNDSNQDWQDFLTWNTANGNVIFIGDSLEPFTKRQEAKIRALAIESRSYIEQHYDAARQRTFEHLYVIGGVNRRLYIDDLWTWIDSVLDEYYSKEDDLVAATDDTELDTITWDLSTFDATDPLISIRAARNIVN